MMKRFELWVVNLDPNMGSEVKKTRPTDDLNVH